MHKKTGLHTAQSGNHTITTRRRSTYLADFLKQEHTHNTISNINSHHMEEKPEDSGGTSTTSKPDAWPCTDVRQCRLPQGSEDTQSTDTAALATKGFKAAQSTAPDGSAAMASTPITHQAMPHNNRHTSISALLLHVSYSLLHLSHSHVHLDIVTCVNPATPWPARRQPAHDSLRRVYGGNLNNTDERSLCGIWGLACEIFTPHIKNQRHLPLVDDQTWELRITDYPAF
ncbi:hypothetical protein CJA_3518 [Cellvibrio japonicus Ueda107]|uniref:Uncharacterized protein n=1 Tax=Cellvibrio japonicus (strain Ueda107) TaxID=498211 RepID=B3PG63_CELJU|nr:hypothetical protein CJA_3518 [Cellvibrio japonicus Ueda107]